jgi:hypothetical protein
MAAEATLKGGRAQSSCGQLNQSDTITTDRHRGARSRPGRIVGAAGTGAWVAHGAIACHDAEGRVDEPEHGAGGKVGAFVLGAAHAGARGSRSIGRCTMRWDALLKETSITAVEGNTPPNP